MVLLVACVGVFPASANMPVVDFTAITEGIAQFLSEVEQWGRQIKQWQSEYDRLVNAAKTMAKGGFNNFMTGLQSMAGQIAGWDTSNGAWDSFFSSFGDVTGMVKDLGNSGADVFKSLQDSWGLLEDAKDTLSTGNFYDVIDGISDGLGGLSEFSKSLGYLGDYVGDISDIANESSILLRAGQELIGLDGIEGLEKAISELEEKILKARSDYMDAVANQNETMANQYLASIESWSDQIQLYQRQIDEFEKNRDMVYARNWELEGEKEARLEASARAVERAMREAEMGAFANNFRNRMYYRFGYGSEVVYEPFKGLTTK